MFIDKNSDAGFAAGGRVLAKGRDALAELVGGGSKGCKTKLPWTGWSHLMLNHEITATPEGAKGRIYLVQLGCAARAASTATAVTRTSTCARPRAGASSRARTCASGLGTRRTWQTPDLN